MTMTMTMRKTIELSILTMAVALFAACGSSSSGGGGGEAGEVATTTGGEAITTVGGVAVTVAAHNHWKAALELFSQYDKEGWNDSKCSEVRSGFEKAIKAQRGGGFGEAEYMVGLTYSRCGDTKKAKEIFEKVLAEHPMMCSPRLGLGLIAEEAGDVQGALAIYREAIDQNPNCPGAYVNLARHQAKGKPDEVEEAIKNLRRALAFRSDYLPAFNEMALIYYQRGRSRDKRSDLDLAEIVLRQAQLIDEGFAPIYNTWGLIKLERGDLLSALQMFQRAIELDDSIFAAQMNFGQITLGFRGYRDAKRAFERAVQLRPRDYDAIVGLGAALRGLEEFDAAEKQYKKAIEIDPNRPDAYFNLGLLYHEYLSAHADSQDGTIARLQEADRWYDTFVQKAGNKKDYADKVADVTRRCKVDKKKRRNTTGDCQMGRKQVIEEFISAMREAMELQREMEEMERLQREQQGG